MTPRRVLFAAAVAAVALVVLAVATFGQDGTARTVSVDASPSAPRPSHFTGLPPTPTSTLAESPTSTVVLRPATPAPTTIAAPARPVRRATAPPATVAPTTTTTTTVARQALPIGATTTTSTTTTGTVTPFGGAQNSITMSPTSGPVGSDVEIDGWGCGNGYSPLLAGVQFLGAGGQLLAEASNMPGQGGRWGTFIAPVPLVAPGTYRVTADCVIPSNGAQSVTLFSYPTQYFTVTA